MAVSTINWHFPRALPATEKRGRLPSASGENEPYGAATDFSPLKGVQGGLRHSAPGNLLEQVFQFSSVAQSCLTLCNPMNRITPGLPVHHQLSEFTQTHVHRVCDAVQPCHPLSPPSPPALNPSQHQSLFPTSQLFT